MKIDKQKIEEWKKQHGEVFLIETQGRQCIVRKPTRKDLSYVSVVKDPSCGWTAMRKSRPTTTCSLPSARSWTKCSG